MVAPLILEHVVDDVEALLGALAESYISRLPGVRIQLPLGRRFSLERWWWWPVKT